MRPLRGLFALMFNIVALVLFLAILPVIAGLAILACIVIGVVWSCSESSDSSQRGPERRE